MKTRLINTADYLLLIDEEAEIKENDLITDTKYITKALDAKYFSCYKVLAYYPLTKEAPKLNLLLLPPFNNISKAIDVIESCFVEAPVDFIGTGSWRWTEKWTTALSVLKSAQLQSKLFSLEDMRQATLEGARIGGLSKRNATKTIEEVNQYIQSLSTQQLLPKDFILGEGTTIEEQIKNGHYTW